MFMISYCIMLCNINIILAHIYIYTHMCMHVCTRTFVDVRARAAQVNPYEYLPWPSNLAHFTPIYFGSKRRSTEDKEAASTVETVQGTALCPDCG